MSAGPGAHSAAARGSALTMAALAFGACAAFASTIGDVSPANALRFSLPWVPSLGANLDFSIDGLSLLFALLITGIGGFVALYAERYLRGHAHAPRLFVILIAFMIAMVGVVTADDIITLFVFWELTTVTSFLLVGFDHASEKARRSAWQALLVTGIGGLALLAGLLLLADAAGTMRISELITRGEVITNDPRYPAILVLILAGAFTKSAQFPFHFWLPNAMAAPTPVSAYLHSATMVKAGVYLLARLHPALGGTDLWMWTLTLVGATTAVWASIVAVRQTDLKLALAYTTVMALGTLTMFLGSDAKIAVAAAATFLVVHALYKCALFLIVGIIDHEAGTRDITRLGGLARAMPVTAAAALAAALSMAGFPPFLGFIGKELKYEGALAVASEPVLVATAAVAANALMVAVAAMVAIRPFFRPAREAAVPSHDAPWPMLAGPVVLGGLGLLFGLLPPILADAVVQPAVSAILGEPETVKLALWHGINLPLALSVLTFAIGIACVVGATQLRAGVAAALSHLPSADRAYDAVMRGFSTAAASITMALQTGSLRWYLAVVFGTTAAAVSATLVIGGGVRLPDRLPDITVIQGFIVALVVLGALMPPLTRSRVAAVSGLGLTGSGIALLFLVHGAPDVAMTQLLVEIFFVVVLAVLILRLPRLDATARTPRLRRFGHGVLAAAFGTMMCLVTLAAGSGPLPRHVADFFAAASVPEAFGRNIVNVILVDFRALDTLGEITVVAAAALAAYALLRMRPKSEDRP